MSISSDFLLILPLSHNGCVPVQLTLLSAHDAACIFCLIFLSVTRYLSKISFISLFLDSTWKPPAIVHGINKCFWTACTINNAVFSKYILYYVMNDVFRASFYFPPKVRFWLSQVTVAVPSFITCILFVCQFILINCYRLSYGLMNNLSQVTWCGSYFYCIVTVL